MSNAGLISPAYNALLLGQDPTYGVHAAQMVGLMVGWVLTQQGI